MHTKRIIYSVIFLLVALLSISLSKYVTIENIQKNIEFLLSASHKHPFIFFLIYISSYLIATILPTPGEGLLSVTGGYIYGKKKGILFATLFTTLGSLIAFLLTRFLIGKKVKQYYKKEYQVFNAHLKAHGKYYLLALRLAPMLPSSIVNFLAGLTPLSISSFLITTFFGVLPITSMYVIAGEKLRTLSSLKDIFTPSWLALFFGFALLACLPPLINLLKRSKLFTS